MKSATTDDKQRVGCGWINSLPTNTRFSHQQQMNQEESVQNAPTEAPAATESGPRAARLNEVLGMSLANTIKVCSIGNFSQCFPTLGRDANVAMQAAHTQVTNFLKTSVEREFSLILEERDALRKLNDLDWIIENARNRKENGSSMDIPPVNLNPREILHGHVYETRKEEENFVQLQLENTYRQNDLYLKELDEQQAEIDEMVGDLTRSLDTLRSSVKNVDSLVTEDVQRDIDSLITYTQT